MVLTKTFAELTLSLKKYEDPRTVNFPLMSNILHTMTICSFYIFFVKVAGPKIMQNRKPFDLRKVLILYNLFQVVLSSWLFYQFASGGWLTGEYNFICQPIDRSNSPKSMKIVNAVWWYFLSKFTELTETFFFVMRKKHEQVNFLHLFHHSIMPLNGWIATKYYPSGHGTFPGLINTFVHVIMYSYYLLSAFGPRIQKYLWWKKYLTTLQMVQFVIGMVHLLQILFTDCDFPRVFVWYMIFLAVVFYTLFSNFYKKTYISKKKNKTVKDKL